MPECGKCQESVVVESGLEFIDGVDLCYHCQSELVDKLPKSAEGIPISFGMELFADDSRGHVPCGILAIWIDEDRDDSFVVKVRDGCGEEWNCAPETLFVREPAANVC
jgi:hypothetical protein